MTKDQLHILVVRLRRAVAKVRAMRSELVKHYEAQLAEAERTYTAVNACSEPHAIALLLHDFEERFDCGDVLDDIRESAHPTYSPTGKRDPIVR